MIDINMNYDHKKQTDVSEIFGTMISLAVYFKDKGFSEEEIMTTLSIIIGYDLKPSESFVSIIKYIFDLCGNYDDFIKLLVPTLNKAHAEIEEGGK